MSELSADSRTTVDGQLVLEPEWVDYLRSQGYSVDAINEAHTVESTSRDISHLVVNISTYDKPKDSPSLDVVADEVDLWVCSCEDWQYNQSADVSEDMVKPSDSGRCKHILSVDRVERAKNDENQAELGL